MTPIRRWTQASTAALTAAALTLSSPLLPDGWAGVSSRAVAQHAASMLVQVTEDGRAVVGLPIVALTPEGSRELATTGTNGLAVVEFGRVPVRDGARVAAWSIDCAGERQLLLVRADATLPLFDDTCRRATLGAVAWYRTERLDVMLGERPRMTAQIAIEVVESRSGWRGQIGPIFTFVGGDELDNVGTGIGGEAMVGYDWTGGLGVGLGLGLSRHSLQGANEGLWRFTVFAEPRYSIDRPQWDVRPYLAGRVAWQNLDPEDGAGLLSESGWSFGGGPGVVVPIIFGLSADFHARYEFLSVSAEGFDRSGSLITLGLGIRF